MKSGLNLKNGEYRSVRQDTRGRVLFARFLPLISVFTKGMSLMPLVVREGMWTVVDGWRGKLGLLVRYTIAKSSAHSCGDVVYIGPYVEIRHWENLRIGSNVSIHRGCYIDASGGVQLGNDVSVAHGTSIVSVEHQWDDVTIPIRDNPVRLEGIRINDDVWIGCGCRIVAGVSVGPGAVVAAGAVVVKDVHEGTLVGGVPAHFIKDIKNLE
jgi:acetyltransferase-like isoleucine patch superfamily enzyme